MLQALHLAVWLVLYEYVLLAISRPLELPLGITAGLAAAAAIAALLGRIGASRWEPVSQVQRASYVAIGLESVTLLGAVGFVLMQFREAVPENADLRLLQSMALAQFISGIMIVPFLARTTGRLGAAHLRPLLAAVLYWAELVLVAALVCWVVSFFSELRFVTMFGYVGPVLAVGFQLAQRNVLIELMRIVQLGAGAAAALADQAQHDSDEQKTTGISTGDPGEHEGRAEQDGESPGRRGEEFGRDRDGGNGEDQASQPGRPSQGDADRSR